MTLAAVRFALATRDELWSLGEDRLLLERRVSHGESSMSGQTIHATDARDDALVAACDVRVDEALRALECVSAGRVRILATARRIGEHLHDAVTLSSSLRQLSIVTTPENLADDEARLRELAATLPADVTIDYRTLPIVWRGGSGAVLLHEAAGHAAEHRHEPLAWPSWLSVRDEPTFAIDDVGEATRATDLLREPPSSLRRESFRDVPLRRMTTLVARQEDAPFAMPANRIDIHLLAGGTYEPLTETVSLYVTAADLVEGDRVRRLPPFEIRESRAAVARALVGAGGDPLRYPGVVCSSEGQDLIVGSYAPRLVTRFG